MFKRGGKVIFINKETGLLNIAKYVPTPNFDSRPACTEVELLVIHNISLPPGQFGGEAIEHFFQNTLDYNLHPFFQQLINLKVSAHLFIRREGGILQFVPFHYRAWHAGESKFNGRENCNDFSIGIELEGTDDIPYTDIQYQQLSKVTRQLLHCFPKITFDHIVGHQAIAPGRKTDPGPAFNWTYYFNLVKKEVSNEADHTSHLPGIAGTI